MLQATSHSNIFIWTNSELENYGGGFTLTGENSGVAVQFTIQASNEESAREELKILMRDMIPVLADCIEDKNEVVLKKIEV